MSATIRTFIGFELRNELLDYITHLQRGFKKEFPNARLVPQENLHLTVAFLGNIAVEQIPAIKEITNSVVVAGLPIAVSVLSLIYLPSPYRARVAALLLKDDSGRLQTIYSQLREQLLKRLGIELERRQFIAHITFARFRKPPRNLEKYDTTIENISSNLERLNIYKSTLTPKGAVYEVIHSVPEI